MSSSTLSTPVIIFVLLFVGRLVNHNAVLTITDPAKSFNSARYQLYQQRQAEEKNLDRLTMGQQAERSTGGRRLRSKYGENMQALHVWKRTVHWEKRWPEYNQRDSDDGQNV